MRWQIGRQSGNVEDRRGMRAGVIGGGGVGVTLIGIVIYLLFGVNPTAVLDTVSGGGGSGPMGAPRDDQGAFSSTILASTEDVWKELLPRRGLSFEPTVLTLYERSTRTGCGTGQAAMGPFYCPRDRRVYLDLTFFRDLAERYGAPGDFARAYVIAHEVAHHIQTLDGTSARMHAAQQRTSESGANALSVRLELQADCYAGVWAKRSDEQHHWLDPGDIESGLAAASAIGDDTLQKKSRGHVVPDSFTHGTSAQRVRWFMTGFRRGEPSDCDTFRADQL